MDINRANLATLFQGFNTQFATGFEQVPDTWKKFCGIIQSSAASNIYPFIEQFGGMNEWTDERTVKNYSSQKIEVVNRHFEDTVSIPRNDIEDDQYGLYGTLVGQMGYNAGRVWQDLAISAILSDPTWIDTKKFFATDRTYGTAAISNKSTSTLSAESYAAARKVMMEYKGHNGKNLGVVPNLLIVGPKNEATAFSILKDRLHLKALETSESTYGVGATENPWNGSAELLVLPELSGTGTEDLWFLAATTGMLKPVFVQQRKHPVLVCLDRETDENVFMNREYIYGTDARGEAFLAFPHLIYKGGASA